MKHTKEPWEADLRSGCCAIYPADRRDDTNGCSSCDERNIAFSRKNSHTVMLDGCISWDMDEEMQANYKRMVLCVNSCAGITNEALEAGVLKGMCEFENGCHEEWEGRDLDLREQTWDGKNIWEDE